MTSTDASAIPSDRLLRVFDAAARHGSLSAAARTLGIGQSAVSHSIGRLEATIGTTLFRRSVSGVELTTAGERLHRRVRQPFDEIDRAVAEARDQAAHQQVTLSVSTSLATFWLMPRLQQFKRSNPGVDVTVITTDSDRGVGVDDADLWIPLGYVSPATSLNVVPLCPERVVPVAAPSVAAALDPGAASLLGAPLLHLEERYESRFDWDQWFRHHNITEPLDHSGYRSNDYSLILQAALDGEGVALGWLHIVAQPIAEGRLSAIGEAIETDHPFQVVTRSGRPLGEPATAMRNWLRREAGFDAAPLGEQPAEWENRTPASRTT